MFFIINQIFETGWACLWKKLFQAQSMLYAYTLKT